MKYMICWNERPQGSPQDYENAQTRILEVFRQWKAPENLKIEIFVVRVGDWGGYMLAECDDPLEVHKLCSMLPAFTFEARPVVPVMDAVRVELEVMSWRDSLKPMPRLGIAGTNPERRRSISFLSRRDCQKWPMALHHVFSSENPTSGLDDVSGIP